MQKRLFLFLMCTSLLLLYPLQRWIDTRFPAASASDDSLYFTSGETIKRMSLGLDALVTDVYWIRTVQYFGRRLIDSDVKLSTRSSIRGLQMDQLAPLLDIIVTLDPHHIPAYRLGAIFLPDLDPDKAIELLEKGVQANPDVSSLYQDLGYVYWQKGDFTKAAEVFRKGADIPSSPWWMRDLAGYMEIQGGSRMVARTLYSSYLNDGDPRVREHATSRLRQLDALDEIDLINKILSDYRGKSGTCPDSFRELAHELNRKGLALNRDLLPVDPDGFPYELKKDTCQAEISWKSTIPR